MRQIPVSKISEIDEIVDFSKKYPWVPHYPPNLVRRFLTELVSSKKLIFDLHDDHGRIAIAVLLDKVNNPANDSCLEILGLRNGVDAGAVIIKILTLALKSVPQHRSGFQVVLPENSELKDVLINFGLKEYYDTYEMNMQIGKVLESPQQIISATVDHRDEIYRVLCRSFAQNPDTSIPEVETWKENFLNTSTSHFYIWKSGGDILGFANLIEAEDSAEIRTIGVLPEARGQGIGYQLLHHCIRYAKEFGKTHCHLAVAIQNEKALGLYLRAGFNVVEKFKCYRKFT